MSEIKHRLNSHDVRTIGKFEAALRKEFDLKVVFRIDHHKEHITNDANLRDICAALEDPNFKNPAQVRQLLAEKMHYMKYPRGTATGCGRCPKDMFAHPERSQVVVIAMPKKKDRPAKPAEKVPYSPETYVSPFEKKYDLADILSKLGVSNLPQGRTLPAEVGSDFLEKYLSVELMGMPGTGACHAMLKHLAKDADSVMVAWAGTMRSIESMTELLGFGKELDGRIISEAKFNKALRDPDYRTREDVAVFMQAKHILGYGLSASNAIGSGRAQFFRRMYERRGLDQKIILVN